METLRPFSALDFLNLQTGSDVVFYVVPNYSDFPCSNFFIFNERGQCYFRGTEKRMEKYLSVKKKFIVVSNTGEDNFIRAFRDHVKKGGTGSFISQCETLWKTMHGRGSDGIGKSGRRFETIYKKQY